MMRPCRQLACLLALVLAACDRPLPPEEISPAADGATPTRHSLTVERHYTLEDPWSQDFSDRITAEAATVCPGGRHTVQATRPIGAEKIGDAFLYRLYEVTVLCTG